MGWGQPDTHWTTSIIMMVADVLVAYTWCKCQAIGNHNADWAMSILNMLRPRQNGCHFPHIFKWIFLNVWISIKISLKFVPWEDNGLAPTQQQAIIWINDGYLVFWCIYASLDLSELMALCWDILDWYGAWSYTPTSQYHRYSCQIGVMASVATILTQLYHDVTWIILCKWLYDITLQTKAGRLASGNPLLS